MTSRRNSKRAGRGSRRRNWITSWTTTNALSIEPKPGLVVRYDYLWRRENAAGRDTGGKDRPCAIVLAAPAQADGSRKVVLCPITHSPPQAGQSAVEIPPRVAQHLGLDHERSWIKTHETNMLTWERGRLPHGIVPARDGQWVFGQLPDKLTARTVEQVRENSRTREVAVVNRDVPEAGDATSALARLRASREAREPGERTQRDKRRDQDRDRDR